MNSHPEADRSASAFPNEAEAAREFERFVAEQAPVDVAAASWWVRRQDGLTPDEEAEFQQWQAADAAHAQALAQLQRLWGRMDDLSEEDIESLSAAAPSPEAIVSPGQVVPLTSPAVAGSPGFSALPSAPGGRGRRGRLLSWMPRVAVAAAVLAMVAGGWHGWDVWQHQAVYQQYFSTVRGQLKEVHLPDGSTLWLDTATRAEVTLYRQRREVRLSEGQVLFAVQPNPDQPFDVMAGHTRVTVVGTRFSVRHTHSGLSGSGGVSVVVEEGRVRVASQSAAGHVQLAQGDEVVELGAGQSVMASARGALRAVVRQPTAPAPWREGRVTFTGTSLAQALAELERYGDTGLFVRDPAVAALRVQGSFDVRHLDAFARSLPQVLPVRLQRRQEGLMEIVLR